MESNQKIKQDRVQSLITLRSQQESRVDSLYNKGRANIAKRVEEQINQSNSEVTRVIAETDDLGQKIQTKNDEIAKLDTEILGLKNNDVASEVGPLKYIAKLTGSSMDSVVNFFILLLVFVFDPMAVCLVLATNITLERAGIKNLADIVPRKKEEDDVVEEQSENDKSTDLEDGLDSNIEFLLPNEYSDEKEVDSDLEVIEIEEQPVLELAEEEEIEKVDEEKIEYKSNEEGEFIQQNPGDSISSAEAVQILNDIKLQGIQTNEKYQLFLESLYMNGALGVGDTLPHYSNFVEDLNSRGIEHEDKEVLDFLTICNLLKVTDMNGSDRRVAKEYVVAKGIFKVLSSE